MGKYVKIVHQGIVEIEITGTIARKLKKIKTKQQQKNTNQ